ncbi:MAG: Txe/YoeB family addiction module toxin [Treponema sp.]|nr:Txe/YoeB family addiction module toxin [Treponema sp.]
MGKLTFTESGWADYLYWQAQDKKTLRKINDLLKAIDRDGFSGIGKPEPLKGREGCWSRRIDDKNRLVYKVLDGQIEIIQCKGHYEDK